MQKSTSSLNAEAPNGALIAILFTVLLDLIGIGIIIPVVAPLILNTKILLGEGYSDAERNIFLGLLLSCYPFAQFFGAPLLGALADRYGRRPVLLMAIAGACLGFAVFALAINLGLFWLLFVSRSVAGFMGGSISIAYSVISDITPPKNRAKNFGLIGAAFGVGFIIGPFLGGTLSNPAILPWFSFQTPFVTSALLAVANFAVVYFFLPETSLVRNKTPISVLTGFTNIQKAFTNEKLSMLFSVSFLVTLGFSFFTQFFQVYMIRKFSFGPAQVANVFAYIGVWAAVTQGGLIRLVPSRFGPLSILRITLLGLSLGLILLLLPEQPWVLFVFMPLVSVSQGFSTPNMNSAISASALPSEQGEIFGISQSLQALGLAIPPLIAGVLSNSDIRLPIIVASVIVFLAWLLLLRIPRPAAIVPAPDLEKQQ